MDPKFIFCPSAGFLNISEIRYIRVFTEYTQLDRKPYCLLNIYLVGKDYVTIQPDEFFKHVLPALNVQNPETVRVYFQSKDGITKDQQEILMEYIKGLNSTTF